VLAVARGAAVGGHHPVEGPVPAPEPCKPDPYHHGSSFHGFLAAAAAAAAAFPTSSGCGAVVWAKGFKGDGMMPVRPTEWASIWAGPVRVLGLKSSPLVTYCWAEKEGTQSSYANFGPTQMYSQFLSFFLIVL
jgi:hypothetical protein